LLRQAVPFFFVVIPFILISPDLILVIVNSLSHVKYQEVLSPTT